MKRSLFFTLLLIPFLLNAQSISLGFGKSSSTFVYKDSNGDKLDNLTSTSGDVISLGYIQPLSDRFDISFGLEKNEYGALSLDQENNLSWDISYFGINLGFDYTFNLITISDSLSKMNNKLLSAVISTNFSNSWLTSGIQEIDDRVYDLKEFDGNFNNLMKMQIGLGLLYDLNDNNSLSLKYSFNRGLNNMETADQELYLSAHHILLGIVIHLKQNKN